MQGLESIELLNLFKEYSGKEFIFVRPGGNHGDSIIYLGAEKLAKKGGIKFTTYYHDQFLKSEIPGDVVVYIHGGGGFNDFWSGAPLLDLTKAVNNIPNTIILGPTTFQDNFNYLRENLIKHLHKAPNKRVILFAREKTSYGIMKELFSANYEIKLDHDTALNLRKEDFDYKNAKRKYVFYAIRGDVEQTNVSNTAYLNVCLDPVKYCNSYRGWLDIHANAKEIITNRTHSAVIGAILGIPTTVLRNKYHKNRSIWEHSLQNINVKWADQLNETNLSRLINSNKVLSRVFNSYKFNKLKDNFYGVARYQV